MDRGANGRTIGAGGADRRDPGQPRGDRAPDDRTDRTQYRRHDSDRKLGGRGRHAARGRDQAPFGRHPVLGRPGGRRGQNGKPAGGARGGGQPPRFGPVSGLPWRVGPHYQDPMNLSVSSAFDGGNIRLVAIEGSRVDLEIVKDHQSDFYQWFYFRLSGAAGEAVELRLLNCAGAAYPHGWENYRACMSVDREEWERVDTSYEGGILTIRLTPEANSVWIAYFAPYTMERHHDLVAEVAAHPAISHRSLGQTLDGQELDYFRLGEGPLQVWLYARQHP